MTEKEQALAYLGRDPVLNISMTEPLRLGRAHVAARSSRGVGLEMDGIAMVTAEAPDEALRLLEAVPEANTWNVMGGALTQAVAEALDLEEGSRCYQAADEAMSGVTNVGNCVYFRTPVEGLTGINIGGHVFY